MAKAEEYKMFQGCVIGNRIPFIEASARKVFEKSIIKEKDEVLELSIGQGDLGCRVGILLGVRCGGDIMGTVVFTTGLSFNYKVSSSIRIPGGIGEHY